VTAVGSLKLKSVGEMVDERFLRRLFSLDKLTESLQYKQHIIIYASVFLFVIYVELLCLMWFWKLGWFCY